MGTIQTKKDAMGFTSAQQRPRCANCAQRDERWEDRHPKDVMTLHCKPGGFITKAWAICNHHTRLEGNPTAQEKKHDHV